MVLNLIRPEIVLVTTLLFRVITVFFYFLTDRGQAGLWNNWFLNTFDHYQLGFLMMVVVRFVKKSWQRQIFSVGLGLVGDEANQVLNVISFRRIPYVYSSWLDWGLTGFFSLIVLIILLGEGKTPR